MSRIHDLFVRRAVLGTRGEFSSAIEALFRRFVGPVLELTARPESQGLEGLPKDRPFILVSNHSGGGGYETLLVAWLWIKQFGRTRRMAGMAHPAGESHQTGPGHHVNATFAAEGHPVDASDAAHPAGHLRGSSVHLHRGCAGWQY